MKTFEEILEKQKIVRGNLGNCSDYLGKMRKSIYDV